MAYSDVQLNDAYEAVLNDLNTVVAKQTSLNIISNRSIINSTLLNDTEYKLNSAVVTYPNMTTAQVEPTITYNATRYTLNWDPGVIKLNDTWTVNYQLIIKKPGLISPIGNDSYVWYMRDDGSTDRAGFSGDELFANDSPNGGLSSYPSPNVTIISPVEGASLNGSSTLIKWNTTYGGELVYDQYFSYRLTSDTDWTTIWLGTPYQNTTSANYTYPWNSQGLIPGNYQIKIEADDHLALPGNCTRDIIIPYIENGQIKLE
jgi:hypothetical protein